jgi:hypothetical protein
VREPWPGEDQAELVLLDALGFCRNRAQGLCLEALGALHLGGIQPRVLTHGVDGLEKLMAMRRTRGQLAGLDADLAAASAQLVHGAQALGQVNPGCAET